MDEQHEVDTRSAAPGGGAEASGISERPFAAVRALFERGLSGKAIARELGLAVQTVRKRLRASYSPQRREARGRLSGRFGACVEAGALEVGFDAAVLVREMQSGSSAARRTGIQSTPELAFSQQRQRHPPPRQSAPPTPHQRRGATRAFRSAMRHRAPRLTPSQVRLYAADSADFRPLMPAPRPLHLRHCPPGRARLLFPCARSRCNRIQS